MTQLAGKDVLSNVEGIGELLKETGFSQIAVELAITGNEAFAKINPSAAKVDVYRERALDLQGVPRAGECWVEVSGLDPATGTTLSEKMVFAHGYGQGESDPVTGAPDNRWGLNDAQYAAGVKALLENPIRYVDIDTLQPTDRAVDPSWSEADIENRFRKALGISEQKVAQPEGEVSTIISPPNDEISTIVSGPYENSGDLHTPTEAEEAEMLKAHREQMANRPQPAKAQSVESSMGNASFHDEKDTAIYTPPEAHL